MGGILSCGVTHTMITPLDLVKCRLQVDGAKYKNLITGFKVKVMLKFGWENFPNFVKFLRVN